VAELVRVLWAYPTHRSSLDQEAGFRGTVRYSIVSISWFIRAACPFDWGWKPENSLQKTDVNWGPRSETTSILAMEPENMEQDSLCGLLS